ASSRRSAGGTIHLTGPRLGLFGTTAIDATGASAGGEVRVGGGFHGNDPSLANAQQVVVGTGAVVDVSALEAGPGGTVAIWADGVTRFAGRVAARGGTTGDGGFVEVSGKEHLAFTGT